MSICFRFRFRFRFRATSAWGRLGALQDAPAGMCQTVLNSMRIPPVSGFAT